jgi:hypothetical protein
MFPIQPSDDQVDTCTVDMAIRGKVFASFDGMLTYGAKTRADYRRLLKRSGVAKGKHRLTAALAALRRFSHNFTNNSFSFFFICCDATA